MRRILRLKLVCLLTVVSLIGCQNSSTEKKTPPKTLFSLVQSDVTNITFTNTVKENLYFNFINYPMSIMVVVLLLLMSIMMAWKMCILHLTNNQINYI